MKESRYNVWVERAGARYVFNGLSGALLRVPEERYQDVQHLVRGETPVEEALPILKQLTTGRMLINGDNDELPILQKRYEISRHDREHFALTMVTSLGCNFDCPYCFEDKYPSVMSRDVEQAVLALLDDQLPHINRFDVTWFGGEPLVGKKPLYALSDAFIERCDRAGVAYDAGIITNGWLLTEQTCAQLRDCRVTFAQVTIDGPPHIHDVMRPLASGKGSFWRIVKNLRHAVDYFAVGLRMNVDTGNFGEAEALLRILATEGLAGKLTIDAAQLTDDADNPDAPSASYAVRCFTNAEYAQKLLQFQELARSYGFGSDPRLPGPAGAPCTAVRANELVVGSNGELYKCWNNVGNKAEVVGDIRNYQDTNGRLHKWLNYNPFANEECRSCIALPVCMGGCAAHAMQPKQYANRCGTFRHTYEEQVLRFVEFAETQGVEGLASARQLAQRMETR